MFVDRGKGTGGSYLQLVLKRTEAAGDRYLQLVHGQSGKVTAYRYLQLVHGQSLVRLQAIGIYSLYTDRVW